MSRRAAAAAARLLRQSGACPPSQQQQLQQQLQQQQQQLPWQHAAAGAAAAAAAGGGSAWLLAHAAGLSTSVPARSATAAAAGVRPRSRLEPLLPLSFEELHEAVRRELALQSAQAEDKLVLLVDKASSQDQVQAALAAVRTNRMKRGRLQQVKPLSGRLFHALLKAGERSGLGHEFAVDLLEQAHPLGLEASRSGCEAVVAACLRQHDFAAARRAWVLSHVHCAGPRGGAPGADAAPWPTKSLLRLYSKGVAQWLAQDGISQRLQARLRGELRQLASELEARGARAPDEVAAALEGAQAGGGGGAAEAEGGGVPAAAEGGGGGGDGDAAGPEQPPQQQ